MATGAVDARWRYNEFTGTYNPLTITDEEHTCEYIEEFNAYGIFANEAIQFDTPSSLVVKQGVKTYTEVSYSTAPAAEQYRASYDVDGHENSGFIEMHISENGKLFKISYKGLGTINHPTFRMNTYHNFPGNVDIENDLDVWTGKLQVTTNGVGVNKAPVNGVELSIEDTMRIYSGSNYSEFNQTAGTGRWKTISSAGTACEINIDPIPDGGTSSSLNSAIRLWRNVITTGNRNLVFYKGDGTATAHSRIAVDGLWSFFTNTAIHIGGSSDPGSDVLEITGNAKFNGDVTLGDAVGDTIDVNGTLNGNADTSGGSGEISVISGIDHTPFGPPFSTYVLREKRINNLVDFTLYVDFSNAASLNAATSIFEVAPTFSTTFGSSTDAFGHGGFYGIAITEDILIQCVAGTANNKLRVEITSDGAVTLGSGKTMIITGQYRII